MFDLITITTPPLDDDKVNHIVWRNGLQLNSKNGVVFYDNIDIKNLKQQNGIYICIETNKRMRMEGSLHKYFNEISGRERNNYNLFSMLQARETIEKLLFNKGIDMNDAYVYHYEIGLNLNVSKDCRDYLDKMKSIGNEENDRFLYVDHSQVNPVNKNERMKVTGTKKVRKYFKVYDKVHECIDKKRRVIPEGNILRIETVMKRMDNCSVNGLFDPDNLKKMIENFFRDWNTIRFEKEIITPKGTGRARQHIIREIIDKGKDVVLSKAKERKKNGSLSDWEYRNIREFITNEWDIIKKSILFIQSDEEKEFRQLLKENHTILKRDEIIK